MHPSKPTSTFKVISLAILLGIFSTLCAAAPEVVASLSKLGVGNEKITVSWSGVTEPLPEDALYIILEDAHDAEKKIQVGYYPMKTIAGYDKGEGSVTFQLFHPREHSFRFAYVAVDSLVDQHSDEHCSTLNNSDFPTTAGFSTRANVIEDAETRLESTRPLHYRTLAVSEAVTAVDPSTPSQIRLTLTHDPTQMMLSYTRGPKSDSPEEKKFASYDYDKDDTPTFVKTSDFHKYAFHDEYVFYSATPFTSDDKLHIVDCAQDPLWQAAGTFGRLDDGSIAVRRALTTSPSALDPTQTYRLAEMCGAPATKPENYYFPGIFQESLLTDLHPGKQYSYTIRGNLEDGPIRTQKFFAAPADSDDVEADFFAFGDLGVSMDYYSPVDQQPAAGPTVRGIMKILAEREKEGTSVPTMVLHIGDISYARGHIVHWDHFFAQLEPVSSKVPWMVTMGNHDTVDPTNIFIANTYANDAGGECGIPVYRRFNMPRDFLPTPYTGKPIPFPEGQTVPPVGSPDAQARSVAFSFDFGPVHFTVFSAEHNFLKGSHQYNFVAADLQAVDRKKTPWVILTSHRPLYCSTVGCGLPRRDSTGLDDDLRAIYEPLMLAHDVDIGLWGHIHAYERTCGITGGFKCGEQDEDGPVHLVVGMAGHPYNGNWINIMEHNPATEASSKLHHQQPDWSIFRTMNFGFTHFKASKKRLQVRYINNQRGTVHDELILKKGDKKKTKQQSIANAMESIAFAKARAEAKEASEVKASSCNLV